MKTGRQRKIKRNIIKKSPERVLAKIVTRRLVNMIFTKYPLYSWLNPSKHTKRMLSRRNGETRKQSIGSEVVWPLAPAPLTRSPKITEGEN